MRVISSGFIICFSAATEITGATLSGKAQRIHGRKEHNCLGGFLGKKREKRSGVASSSVTQPFHGCEVRSTVFISIWVLFQKHFL